MKGKLKQYDYSNFSRAKASAIKHYNRMIEWVTRTQPLDGFPDKDLMEKELHENWTAHYCSFCHFSFQRFRRIAIHENVCEFCPIGRVSGSGSCYFTPWYDLDRADTWQTWLEHAKAEIAFLETLRG